MSLQPMQLVQAGRCVYVSRTGWRGAKGREDTQEVRACEENRLMCVSQGSAMKGKGWGGVINDEKG